MNLTGVKVNMELMLHVGHDKTGSSYLQSALAKSVSLLESQGVWYPTNKRILKAAEGKISSGNGALFTKDFDGKDNADYKKILFSSEKFFRNFNDEDFNSQLDLFIKKYGVKKVSLLLYIRDPIEHFSSSFQQAIKRGGYTGTVDEFIDTYMHPKRVSNFIQLCVNNPKFDLAVINYSKVEGDLVDTLEAWLQIENKSLLRPNKKRVNRSLTLGELEFQRVANHHFGKPASILADTLCDELPEINAENVYLTESQQSKIYSKIKQFCDKTNENLKALGFNNAFYKDFNIEKKEKIKSYSFTPDQIETIAEVFSTLKG